MQFLDLALLASISTEQITARGAAILANIGVLAVVGAAGYGVFLWALSGAGASDRRLSYAPLAGLAVLAASFVGQSLLARTLRGDEPFAFFGILLLSLLGMWVVSLVVWAFTPTWSWLMATLAWDAGLVLPVLLSMVYLSSR